LPSRYYKAPSATKEELDSPGWILPVINTTLLLYYYSFSFVIQSTGMWSPHSDFIEGIILTLERVDMNLISLE
jgi:hypothetical protein